MVKSCSIHDYVSFLVRCFALLELCNCLWFFLVSLSLSLLLFIGIKDVSVTHEKYFPDGQTHQQICQSHLIVLTSPFPTLFLKTLLSCLCDFFALVQLNSSHFRTSVYTLCCCYRSLVCYFLSPAISALYLLLPWPMSWTADHERIPPPSCLCYWCPAEFRQRACERVGYSSLLLPCFKPYFWEWLTAISVRKCLFHGSGCESCSCPDTSTDHGVSQARILEWVATPSPRDLPNRGIEPTSPLSPVLQVDSLPAEPLGRPLYLSVDFSDTWPFWSWANNGFSL